MSDILETNATGNLCWKCQSLLSASPPQNTGAGAIDKTRKDGALSRTINTHESLQTTVDQGCLLCLHLLYSLGRPAREALDNLNRSSEASTTEVVYDYGLYMYPRSDPGISLHVHTTPEAESTDEIKTRIELFPEASETPPEWKRTWAMLTWPDVTPFANDDEILGSTDSDASRIILSTWMDRCLRNHTEACNPVRDATREGTLPTRVVDIRSSVPKLLVVRDDTPILPYATVSHCWGPQMPFRLLLSNIAELQEEIPNKRLSRTWQDAIQVARRLGLGYIWIDSLCIIQDSPEDWEKESATMAKVYSKSYLNIAAARAADGTQGCFTPRDPHLVRPLQVFIGWGPDPGRYYAIKWLYWRSNVTHTPLNARAWVFQERYLAPRNVYFGETQLYWECLGCLASETFPGGLPPGTNSSPKSLDPHVEGALVRQSHGLTPNPDLDAFSMWDQIVYGYSNGTLTYSEDKLVAISGLASRMQKHIRSDYLAGLWRKYLPYQLLWTVGGVQWFVRAGRPTVYLAPTWSWASRQGIIEKACEVRHTDDHELVLDILEAKVDLVNPSNPFGRVEGGYIKAKGYLAKVGVHLEDSSTPGVPSLLVQNIIVGDARIDDFICRVGPMVYDGLYYLPVRCSPKRHEEVTMGGTTMLVPQMEGLLLQTATPDNKDQFVRVGSFRGYSDPAAFQDACRLYSWELLSATEGAGGSEGWGPKVEITIV